ncbi:hypothetical protein LSCM1_03033 [Leishmania martiniquensis]|uniref:Palmitoyltransferase n=1 Tax=Leishmania martiniquensis TaxID=1580590 RepID=A0A836GIC6_9TRYP|nr:hypothetical protein LSCM1_03033 [Leishmania martiniquensis]
MNAFMAGAPMLSSNYQRYDAPGALYDPSSVSARSVAAKIPPALAPRPKPKELSLPVVNPELYMRRRNSTREALGTFRRVQFFRFKFYFSTDFLVGAIPMGITVVLIVANMALVWHHVGWYEYSFTLVVLAITFSSYFLTTSSDPGIYPRLRSGEQDPLQDNVQLVFCRECRLRRPPRCAHCYHCKVCVLEHDHHCSILGGCVGVRNLRWFALYLLSCSSSTMIGVVWLIRYLFNDLFTPDDAEDAERGPAAAPTPFPTMPGGRRSFAPVDHTGSHLAAIFVLLIDGFVVIVVVGMLCMYTYLTLTSTTRRESMRKENSLKALLRPRSVWRNFKKMLSPPPSLLDSMDLGNEEAMDLI